MKALIADTPEFLGREEARDKLNVSKEFFAEKVIPKLTPLHLYGEKSVPKYYLHEVLAVAYEIYLEYSLALLNDNEDKPCANTKASTKKKQEKSKLTQSTKGGVSARLSRAANLRGQSLS